MLIERAELLSRNEIFRQSFSFRPDRLNLFSTEEEQKKNDLFASFCAVLWGELGATSITDKLKNGNITLQFNGKRLEFDRDFESNKLELKSNGNKIDDQNEVLDGLSKEIFNTLFLVGQDQGSSNQFADRTARLKLLGQFASMSESSSGIDKAVKVVEEKLDNFPFKGKTYKIDDLIAGLGRGKVVLEERLLQLEKEHDEASSQIGELKKLDEDLALAKRTQKREEYFELCLETADLESRIMKVQQRLAHESEIKRELEEIGNLSNFPISSLRRLQDLWTMRLSKTKDRERLETEIQSSLKDASILQSQYIKHTAGLEVFALEDAQQLYSLAKSCSATQEEHEQLIQERAQEMRRVKESGVDFDSISFIRKAILSMDPKDLEEAHKLSSELRWQKDKLASLVAISENSRNQLKTLGEEINRFQGESRRLRVTLISAMTVAALASVVTLLIPNSVIISTLNVIACTSFVLLLLVFLAFPPLLNRLRKDMESKETSLIELQGSYDNNELTLSNEIVEIQRKGDQVASWYDFESSIDMFKKLQTYSSISAQLKQLDINDHMIANREQTLVNLSREASTYFEKLNQKPAIYTPNAISGLASEIMRHKESSREIEQGNAVLNHRRSESRFLEGEVYEIEAEMEETFRNAKLEAPEDIEKSFKEFELKAHDYTKWDNLTKELLRLEKDLASEILDQDLTTLLNKLQNRRTDAANQMYELVARYPDILTETLEDSEIGRTTQGQGNELEQRIQDLQSRADGIRVLLRTSSRNFDEFHPKTQHDLEILERDLVNIRHTKNSLNVARVCLMRVAQESKSSWSQELAEISEDLLKDSSLEIKKIEWNENMEMLISIANHSSPIHESELERKVSRGLIKQINWLTRLMLCRYICRRLPLPIVLDEPFCDLDDGRFVSCMELLVRKVLPHCQVIVLTCQKVRHQWFLDRLPESDKLKFQFVKA